MTTPPPHDTLVIRILVGLCVVACLLAVATQAYFLVKEVGGLFFG
ncbi:hypothetical protein M2A_3274 [Tepidicaulis marinus]|uniref:Uncharacterized protein n=1 Tax=Tepidicaulis marinus TaxID=1333998 RepID=A0A081BFF7_9HYPH|nr:hypothetical protein [Tepidicaulis marinus]GAK46775.1 hypothetical protein M2A_3274 [Tepidicaulis marinus]